MATTLPPKTEDLVLLDGQERLRYILERLAPTDDVIRKAFPVEVKSLDEQNYKARVVITTARMDRHREVVLSSGMVASKRLPLVSAHNYYDLRKVIGKVLKLYPQEKSVEADVLYYVGMGNPEADWAWKLVQMGAAYSIGFRSLERKDANLNDEEEVAAILAGKKPIRTHLRWELVEVSHVVVPANPDAVNQLVTDGYITAEKAALILKSEGAPTTLSEELDENWDLTVALMQEEEEEHPTAPEEDPDVVEPGDEPELPEDQPEKGVEETTGEIRIRVKAPGTFQADSFRRITLKKDKPRVFAVIGKPKGASKTEVQSLRFPKEDGWTMAKARAWAKGHDFTAAYEVVRAGVESVWDDLAPLEELDVFIEQALTNGEEPKETVAPALMFTHTHTVDTKALEEWGKSFSALLAKEVSAALDAHLKATFPADSTAHIPYSDLASLLTEHVAKMIETAIRTARGDTDFYLER